MNVMIAGLTAAGKTTHSHLLSETYGLNYISATEALAQISGVSITLNPTDSKFWISEQAEKINALRKEGDEIDLAVDSRLTISASNMTNTVFDSFGLPWTSSSSALRIWLESSFESRVLKAIVSHRGNKGVTRGSLITLLREKDEQIRQHFLSHYGFDLYSDRSVFDLVIDISNFIRRPHLSSSKRSIALVDEILSSLVGWYLESKEDYRIRFNQCIAHYGFSVFTKLPSGFAMKVR